MGNDKEDDLLVSEKQLEIINKRKNAALSGTIKYLKEQGALDSDIQAAREISEGFDPNNVETFDDSLIYRAYYAAKKCKTASLRNLAHALGMSPQLLKFYCEQYPKLGLAIQAGYMDAVDMMKENLVSKLYEAAMGTTVSNSSTTTQYIVDDDGNKIPTNVTEVEHTSQVVPNVSAQLELLKRLDPAWIPKVGVDIRAEINENLHVVEDVNVQVDYKKLSVSALKELLRAGKTDEMHTGASVTESGEGRRKALNKLYDRRKENKSDEEIKSVTKSTSGKRRGRPANILKQHQQDVENAKNNINLEEQKNGNKAGNRGRKKKDS